MIFITSLKAVPGRYQDAIRQYKNCKAPKNIKIREFLGTFGDVDCLLVFEAPDEGAAAEFVMQFSEYSVPMTHVAFPVEKYKWTR